MLDDFCTPKLFVVAKYICNPSTHQLHTVERYSGSKELKPFNSGGTWQFQILGVQRLMASRIQI